MNVSSDPESASSEQARFLKEEIDKNVEAFFPGWLGREKIYVYPFKTRSRHFLTIIEAVDGRNRKRLLAKGAPEGNIGNQNLHAEYQLLSEICPKIESSHTLSCSPRIVAYFPERNLLVREWVHGRSLASALLGASSSFAARETLWRIGAWLGALHAVTWDQERGNPCDFLLEYFCRPKVASSIRSWLGPQGYDELLTLVQDVTRRDAGQTPMLVTHHDFSPANVMVTESGFQIIDFASARPGFAYHDVTLFKCFYEALPFWRRRLMSRLEPIDVQMDAFMDGYKSKTGGLWEFDQQMLSLFRLRSLSVWLHRVSPKWHVRLGKTLLAALCGTRFPEIWAQEMKHLQTDP
jgi:tRNA A-37 threonylcarbamoyl transferase component Bud32